MPQDPTAISRNSNRPCILVVDDEQQLTDLISDLLPNEGYDVLVANSAREALNEIARSSISMLLTDIIMPDTDGIELAREAAQREPGLHIGYMTGYFDELEDSLGPDRPYPVLRKPFTVGQLYRFVTELAGMPGQQEQG